MTVENSENYASNVQNFLKIAQKYTHPTKLTPVMLRELVDKVVAHAPDKSSGHRVQLIDIHYNFIGEIDLSTEYAKNRLHDDKISCSLITKDNVLYKGVTFEIAPCFSVIFCYRFSDRRQMRCASAARISSSRNIGCAIEISFSARSHVDRPARFTTPYSVAMRCA